MAQVVEEAESIENGRLSRSASFPVISIHANDENPADLREKSKSTLFTGSTREAFFELKKAKRNKLLKKTVTMRTYFLYFVCRFISFVFSHCRTTFCEKFLKMSFSMRAL